MREIKFRARGQVGRKIWYYGLLTSLGENVCHIKDDEMHEYICDTDTLGQYIGIKDKNGKEIYEGDIIQIPNDYEKFGMACGEEYEVDFKNGRFRLKPKYRTNSPGYDVEGLEECKVLGNIYDNPKLLEKVKHWKN